MLLLDEPTVNLDPLSTYLIVSMLSSYAKRKSRAVLLTMEKPRSDVLPFLDRTAYLCLGDLIYAGPTRLMLEYFRSIGFPCPELENPLMYYCKCPYLYKSNKYIIIIIIYSSLISPASQAEFSVVCPKHSMIFNLLFIKRLFKDSSVKFETPASLAQSGKLVKAWELKYSIFSSSVFVNSRQKIAGTVHRIQQPDCGSCWEVQNWRRPL